MVTILCGIASLFLVLFLGGMASAALEIRREKRAGIPVTRPGWERKPRHLRGPRSAYLRGLWLAYVVREKGPAAGQPCPVCGGRLFSDDRPSGAVVVCMDDFTGKPDQEAEHDRVSGQTWAQRHVYQETA